MGPEFRSLAPTGLTIDACNAGTGEWGADRGGSSGLLAANLADQVNSKFHEKPCLAVE